MTPSNTPLKYTNTILYRAYMFRRHIRHPQGTLPSSSISLSDDRFKAPSKTIPSHTAIHSFLLQTTVSSSVLKAIQ